MNRQLFDLAGRDPGVRFSPYCWRVRMALAHKSLPVTTVPWRFTDKAAIAFSNSRLVPVLVDGAHTIADSMAIADYLDRTYPEQPLFESPAVRALANFVRHWTESVLFPGILEQILVDIPAALAVADLEYFRTSREQRLGMTLEAFCANRDASLPLFLKQLNPLRLTLAQQTFLCGERAQFPDYIVFGAFQWARCVTARVLLPEEDPVHLWFGRMLQLFDGLGASAPRASVDSP